MKYLRTFLLNFLCRRIKRYSALTCCAFRFSDFNFRSACTFNTITLKYLFYSLPYRQGFIFKINITVKKPHQFACSESCIKHQNICRGLPVFPLSVFECAESFCFKFINFFRCKNCYRFTLGKIFFETSRIFVA